MTLVFMPNCSGMRPLGDQSELYGTRVGDVCIKVCPILWWQHDGRHSTRETLLLVDDGAKRGRYTSIARIFHSGC